MLSPLGRLRFGIFGGSFDPVHEGHLCAAESARAAFGLARVLLVPADMQPLKAAHASAQHRLAMVKLAVEDREGLEGSDIEIKRGGTSFTIDTVRKLSWDIGTDIELFLLMGTDAARGVPHWRGVPEIFKYVRPIVLERTGDDPIDWDVLARQLPAGLADEFRASIVSLTRPTKISSTEIRRRLGDGSAVSGIVPKAVEDYIHQYGLYGARLGKRRKD